MSLLFVNFPDVFLEELPGLPPDKEIEFCIDVVPGTVSHFFATLQDGTCRVEGAEGTVIGFVGQGFSKA